MEDREQVAMLIVLTQAQAQIDTGIRSRRIPGRMTAVWKRRRNPG